MTRKGAQMVIDMLCKRYLQIQDLRFKLDQEEKELQARIMELEQVRDPIEPDRIINVGE